MPLGFPRNWNAAAFPVVITSFRGSPSAFLRSGKSARSSRKPTKRWRTAAASSYQVTNELRQHATLFDRAESEYFLQNIPPMFITVFHKMQRRNGYKRPIRPAVALS